MILIDLNQVMISNMMAQLGGKGSDISEDLVRHMILNSIRGYNVKFKEEFGDIIICCDSRHYWRREVFPNYKSQRKQAREESSHDWDNIFTIFNQVRDELKEHMPYRVVDVYGAEADDIIAVLVKNHPDEKMLILSGDKDFIQLQKYPNLTQWSPITKKQVNGFDPTIYLKEHILRGDTSDGVPNVLSPDNTFVDGLRQRPLSRKKIQSWLIGGGSNWNDEVKRNFQRNSTLIDLSRTPEELKNQIRLEYNNAPHGDRSKLLNYFMQNKLKELTENIGEF